MRGLQLPEDIEICRGGSEIIQLEVSFEAPGTSREMAGILPQSYIELLYCELRLS
jgi:hypothetical protein